MRVWHDFLDSIDSDGGTRFILMLLIGVGIFGTHFGIMKSEEITTGAFGALLMTMKDAGSNKDRRDGPPMPLPTSAGAQPTVSPQPVPQEVASNIVEAVDNVADAIKGKKIP
jgi:hypothetical protein